MSPRSKKNTNGVSEVKMDSNTAKSKTRAKKTIDNGLLEHPIPKKPKAHTLIENPVQSLPVFVTPEKKKDFIMATSTNDSATITSSVATNNSIDTNKNTSVLFKFGLTPAPQQQYRNGGIGKYEKAYIKGCIIRGQRSIAIIYRLGNGKNDSYPDYLLWKANETKAPWMQSINMIEKYKLWYHENKAQINTNNYNTKLFFIRVKELTSYEPVYEIAKYICDVIKKVENKPKIFFDQNNFFWLPEPVVWADVIGYKKALDDLINITTDPYQGYFERYKDTISEFFHLNSIPDEFRTLLYAPGNTTNPRASILLTQNENMMRDDIMSPEILTQDSIVFKESGSENDDDE